MNSDHSLILHQLVQSGDTLALSKLYDEYGENIVNVLRIDFADLAKQDDSYLFEAVNEAFMGYYNNPSTFDSSKKTLKNFLILAAKRDLQNIIQKNKKHRVTLSLSTDVEVKENSRNSIEKNTHSAEVEIIQNESVSLVNKELGKYFNNKNDIEIAKMILGGERETEVYAAVLQIETLEIKKKQEEVKRHKDRIKKILKRNQVELRLKKLLQ